MKVYDESCNWQKTPLIQQNRLRADCLTNSFGENELAGLWKSGILEHCDLVSTMVTYTLGCTQRVKADHKPTPGVQHA